LKIAYMKYRNDKINILIKTSEVIVINRVIITNTIRENELKKQI
jgi:hypothetical protein